jgi:flagellin-like protein
MKGGLGNIFVFSSCDLKRRDMKKRGLSPVIASVLLIFLVLILASIIFLWARGFFSEQLEKGGEAVENQCSKIIFTVEPTASYAGQGSIELDFSNLGDIAIYTVNIKEIGGGGDEASHPWVLNLGVGEGKRLIVDLEDASVEEIIVSPVLLGQVKGGDENKPFTCKGSEERIVL